MRCFRYVPRDLFMHVISIYALIQMDLMFLIFLPIM